MTLSPSITSSQPLRDRLLGWIVRILAGIAGTILVLIIFFLLIESFPAIQHVGIIPFFTDTSWHPTERLFNLTPMLVGTLWCTVGAILIATPLGILSALFSQYYAPASLAQVYRRFIELLAGIPSVVYGFWGLVVLIPIIGRIHPPGPSLLAGVLILTMMVLPTIALTAEASLAQVPSQYFQGGVALGFRKATIIRKVLIPAAKSGLLTGVILATGRAIGETMALMMVCGNVVNIPSHPFEPVRTLTANIALEMAYAVGDHRSVLFINGLLLLTFIIVLVGTAERISRGRIYG